MKEILPSYKKVTAQMANSINRRDFIKLSGLGLGALAFKPSLRQFPVQDFPDAARLGRVTTDFGEPINLRLSPSTESAEVGVLYGDEVVPWLREVVGYTPYRNQRWVETPNGYIWSPLLQPVENNLNAPLAAFPERSQGKGMWVEVTLPYVNVKLANVAPIGPRITFLTEEGLPLRLYYGQVMWADDIRQIDNAVEYHVRELHGSYGDHFLGAG